MRVVWFVFICTCFMACEKSITIQPETQKSLLVVDGTIENGEAPYIILSNSLNYFSAINPQILVSSLVSNAKVTLSDGARTVQLKEYSQRIGGFNLVYYSHDTTTTTGMMTGKEGGSYTLNIDYNSSSYSAVTHIPVVAKTVDSLWWKPAPQNRDTTLVVLMAKLNDPKGYGNYIRYYTRVNSSNFLPGFNSVFDDQVVDGMVYDTQVDRGFQRDGITNDEEYGFFKRGDTITTKLANIDKATFDFWRTLEFSYQSVGNPFANPTKVLGNVGNGALGAFCGYGVQYNTLIVPK